MVKFGVTSTSTVSRPSTTTTAATNFPRFREDATFEAYGIDGRRHGCSCVYVLIGQTQRRKHGNSHCLLYEMMYLHGVSVALTFAGLDALRPPVISVSVAGTPAILIPSTVMSATTDST